jgi:hypothetical protein
MTSPPGKVRTRGHVLADLSINYVERQVLLCGCSVQRVHSDYGYDLMMSTYNAQGEIEGGIVFFQVKATDHLPVLADGKAIAWSISRRDLRLWFNEAYPVILVVYAGPDDRAYWLHVQAAPRAGVLCRLSNRRLIPGRGDHYRSDSDGESSQPPLARTNHQAQE